MKKMSHIPCVACGKVPTDRAHVRSAGAGGPMNESNIIQLCRLDHRLQHSLGWNRFIEKYPNVGKKLNEMGFEIQDVFGVRKLCKK